MGMFSRFFRRPALKVDAAVEMAARVASDAAAAIKRVDVSEVVDNVKDGAAVAVAMAGEAVERAGDAIADAANTAASSVEDVTAKRRARRAKKREDGV